MISFLDWLLDQRSMVAGVAAIVMFVVTLVLRYGFGLWWPWGIAVATILGIVAIVNGSSE